MSLPKFKELPDLNSREDIENKIHIYKKILFELKMKRATNQQVLPHLFSQTKRRIAQLFTKSRTSEFFNPYEGDVYVKKK